MTEKADPTPGLKLDQFAPGVGVRVWLLGLGRAGRILALAHGGLACRVRLEEDGSVVSCVGADLLPLAAQDPD